MSDCAHENLQLSMRDTRLFCDDCGRLWVSEDCVTDMRKAAEARCKRLMELLREMTGWSDQQIEEGIVSNLGALSDTAQPTCPNCRSNRLKTCDTGHRECLDCSHSWIDDLSSNTAQQETGGHAEIAELLVDELELSDPAFAQEILTVIRSHGFEIVGPYEIDPAYEMRERAAKLVEDMTVTFVGTGGDLGKGWQYRKQFAAAIRALPIDPETGGE